MAGINEKLPQFFSTDEILARGLNTMARAVERVSLFPSVSGARVTADGNGVSIMPDQFDPAILFYNADSANSIPAYGIALLNGTNTDTGTPMFKVKQPDVYGCQSNWLLNGGSVIPKSSFGWGQAVFGMGPCGEVGFKAAYDSNDGTPAQGSMWGPQSGTYLLKKNSGGFQVQGIYDSTNHIAMVVPAPMLSLIGKTNAAIGKGASGVVNVWTGSTIGSESANGQTVTAYNRYANVAITKWVRCAWNFDSSAWDLVAAEC